YSTWIDGFDNPSANGSTIGYVEPFKPTMESEIVHGGGQSAPLAYDNSAAGVSEVTANPANLSIGADWTGANIRALTLYVHGSEDNVGGQLYVKVNDVKLAQVADLAEELWQEVNIDLASFGVNLQNVTSLTIGIEGAGSSGLVLIDDIRLYPSRCIPEKVPGDLTRDCVVDAADLAVIADNWLVRPLSVEYTFDSGLSDTSGNGRNGVGRNNPAVAAGILTLNGANFIDIPLGSDNPFDGTRDFSIAMDFKANAPSILLSSARDDEPGNHSMSLFVHRWDEPFWGEVIYDNFSVGASAAEDNPLDGEWHTVVVTYDADDEWVTVYLDGIAGAGAELNPAIPDIATDTVRIGGSLNSGYPYDEGVSDLVGDVDNVRIFNFALTPDDVLRLPAVPMGPADLNGDGIVDQADRDILEANMGPEKLWP
ncbi:MAG: LamG domain-containing protein, partial [Planctomycetota bacterium]